MSLKIAYLRGRPDGHPIHNAYAQAIGATFHFIDEAKRYHDQTLPAWQRYYRWWVNAWRFPWEAYDGLLIEGPHIWPPLMGKLKRKPVWSLIDEQTLYFLYDGYYKPSTRKALLYALRHYTGFLVIGEMLASLAKQLLGAACPPVYVGFNGVEEKRLERLAAVQPQLEQPMIVLVAHGEEGWRVHYKGLDLFVETIWRLQRELPTVQGLIVGRWKESVQTALLSRYPGVQVAFLGPVSAIEAVFAQAGLYFHPARGEAWGIAVQEAMAAGLPALVSEWTGAQEVVRQVWPEGIIPLSAEKAAEKILSYFALPLSQKKALSEKGRTLILSSYTRTHAVERFKRIFAEATAPFL